MMSCSLTLGGLTVLQIPVCFGLWIQKISSALMAMSLLGYQALICKNE